MLGHLPCVPRLLVSFSPVVWNGRLTGTVGRFCYSRNQLVKEHNLAISFAFDVESEKSSQPSSHHQHESAYASS
jgi:hypothetical protein